MNTLEKEKTCCGPECCTEETSVTIESSSSENLKSLVKEKYSEIANQSKEQNESSCCGSSCCSTEDFTIMSEDYSNLKGYNPDADLGLGCGLPTEFALIEEGDTVIDLGSGAGNDCFVARAVAGEKGKVIGVDMTEAMITKARANAFKLGFNNVEFVLGDIENIPLPANIADVVVSNCVMNLVPDKRKAFGETFRLLKPEGHFSISDIVLEGALPEQFKEQASLYAGCISGAIQKADYLTIVKEAGFVNISLQKEKKILLPDDILDKYLTSEELKVYKESNFGIYSITVYAEKPSLNL
ncbi:MAG TPA: arsenite methyltransferase [Cytophagales bacterium]|nr:arsenite methyltransferase [Cytophagales bacterium]